jgi:hypothetical protein
MPGGFDTGASAKTASSDRFFTTNMADSRHKTEPRLIRALGAHTHNAEDEETDMV